MLRVTRPMIDDRSWMSVSSAFRAVIFVTLEFIQRADGVNTFACRGFSQHDDLRTLERTRYETHLAHCMIRT